MAVTVAFIVVYPSIPLAAGAAEPANELVISGTSPLGAAVPIPDPAVGTPAAIVPLASAELLLYFGVVSDAGSKVGLK